MDTKFYQEKTWTEKYNTPMKMCLPFRFGKEKDTTRLPDEKIGCCSYMSLNWFNGLMWKASRKGLEENNIGKIRNRNGVDANSTKLHRLWEEELAKKGFEKASLLKTLCRFNRTRLIIASLFILIMTGFHYVGQTWILLQLLDYLDNPELPLWNGVVWAIAVSVGQLCRHLMFSAYWVTSAYAGVKIFGALQGVIYDHVLRHQTSGEIQLAEVINYCTADVERVYQLMQTSLLALASPISWILNVAYCYQLIGVWSLIGNFVIILYYPFMIFVAKSTGKTRAKSARTGDKRISYINQFLSNIKFVKSMVWEYAFFNLVKDIRGKEMKILKSATYLQSLSWSTAPIIGVIAPMVTIIGHLYTGGVLDSPQVFTLIAAYGALSFPLNTLPISVKAFSEGVISCKRIQKMLEPKTKLINVEHEDNPQPIVITNADVGWEIYSATTLPKANKKSKEKALSKHQLSTADLVGDNNKKQLFGITNMGASESILNLHSQSSATIQNINLSVEKNQLIGICGPVGSGKSTLLSTLCGNTNIFKGNVNVNGSIALATQQAWIFSGTVKDNIVFGLDFDSEWYKHVINSCCLEKDFKLMSNGDQTKIGERGANLSGGQKQRINLARALYSRRDIYLLDDPLSAIDAKVAKYIFKNCIQRDLAEKTVILVTHAIKYLKKCDYVVVMQDGKIVEQGTHETLMANGEEYNKMIKANEKDKNEEENENQNKAVKRVLSAKDDIIYEETTSSVEAETITTVTLASFLQYCKCCGGYIVSFLVLLTIILFDLGIVFNNVWLNIWLKDKWNSTEILNSTTEELSNVISLEEPKFPLYFGVYVGSLGIILILGFFKGLAVGSSMLRGAGKLHWLMFWKVVRSPMSFFDTTPLGQIINRFSRDMDELDTYIPYYTEFVAQILILTLFQMLVICVFYPWFSFALAAVVVLYIIFDKLLVSGIRETKRIDNFLKPAVTIQMSSTVQGLEVIKCYNKQELVSEQFKDAVEKHLSAYLMYQLSPKWFSFRADIIGWLAVTGTAFMVLFSNNSGSAGDGGLAMTQILLACNTLAVAMRWKSELEAKFISLERVCNYSRNLVEEAPAKISGTQLPEEWPSQGNVEFQNVQLRYRPDCPLVLQNLTVSINGGEKVGIIGRTGAGKSSIVGAILRLTEIEGGSILIDNVDISKLGLDDLRNKIAIIPQEPVLLDGTIRWNLDPAGRFTDDQIWHALERSHLKSKISKEAQGLDTLINAESGILSAGEKQLFCLARALLKQSKILLLDEATANVDFETDKLIQVSIRQSFANCTVLTIAHRLNTIIDYDKIMTLDAGKVVEMDTPANLLARDSQFRSMLNSQ